MNTFARYDLVFIVNVGNMSPQIIGAHRHLATQLSPVLRKYVEERAKPSTFFNGVEVVLDDVNVDTLRVLLRFSYYGKLRENLDITPLNIESLLETAVKLEMDVIQNECFKYYGKSLTVANCFEQNWVSSPFLLGILNTFIVENFEEASKQESWAAISHSNVVLSWLTNADLVRITKNCVRLAAISRWVAADKNRSNDKNLISMMKTINILRVPYRILQEQFKAGSPLGSIQQCYNMYVQTMENVERKK